MKTFKKICFLILSLCLFSMPFAFSQVVATTQIELASVVLNQDTFEYTGEEIQPQFTVYDINGDVVAAENYTYEYRHAVDAGNSGTNVYVSAKSSSNYKGTIKKFFTITPISIKNATVSAIKDQVYTGSSLKPYPTLTFKGKTLVKGTDYLLTYTDNKNAGTATITITGTALTAENKTNRNFTGTTTVTFKIKPRSIEKYKISAITDRTYTGSAITPSIALMNGDTKIGSSNYKLTYKNNVNAGTATVTAKGIGNYSGSLSAEFKILPKEVTPKITLSKTSYDYDGTVKKPKVKSVTYGSDNIAISSSYYTVKYSSDCKNAGTYTVTVTLSGNFKGKNTKNFKIAPKSIHGAEISLSQKTYTYNGKACKPKVTVVLNGVTLKKGTDYELIYSTNKNAGAAGVQVKGIGNYKHYSKTQFFVIRKEIQKFKVSAKADCFNVSYSKVKKSAQELPLSKTLKITDTVGSISYAIGNANTGYFTINEKTGAISIAKGTPKGTYSLTLRLCAKGDTNHMICYRLVDIKIKVK